MLNGNMVAGTLRGELLVRIGKEANDAALARPHTHMMEMSRPAPGYIMVTAEGTKRDRDLKAWLDEAAGARGDAAGKEERGGESATAR